MLVAVFGFGGVLNLRTAGVVQCCLHLATDTDEARNGRRKIEALPLNFTGFKSAARSENRLTFNALNGPVNGRKQQLFVSVARLREGVETS